MINCRKVMAYKQDDSTFVFLTRVLAILMDAVPLSFTTRFLGESFVSYHLIWHIPLNKTHTVTSFSLEFSNSLHGHLQNVSSKTEKPQRLLRQLHHAVQISFLQSFQTSLSFKIPRLRRSVGKSE